MAQFYVLTGKLVISLITDHFRGKSDNLVNTRYKFEWLLIFRCSLKAETFIKKNGPANEMLILTAYYKNQTNMHSYMCLVVAIYLYFALILYPYSNRTMARLNREVVVLDHLDNR